VQKRKKAMDATATFHKAQTTMNKENLDSNLEVGRRQNDVKQYKLQTDKRPAQKRPKRQQLAKYNYDKACLTKQVRTLSCSLSFRQ
jgi:hypothetical protein